MPIPDYQTIMLPLLKSASDGKEHSVREATLVLANSFNLTEEERNELLPSGKQTTFNNRIGWARTYLSKAGLLKSTKRGFYQITDSGVSAIANNPQRIDLECLKQYQEFTEFMNIKSENIIISEKPQADLTPEESLEASYQTLRNELASELLQIIKKCSPAFFERLVVDMLVSMGYGGSRKEAGQALGKSGDEGIDGVIREDKLGLDTIYLQAKRWDGVVGRPEIQKFAGALQGQRANKGVFITTSSFTKEATAYVSNIGSKIILIDGQQLTEFMMDYNVGITPISSYEIKKIDSDYFIEE